ncbi:MAG: hypothetical protein EBZ49_02725 [Proteobacteria bacterium]|nr:hypothetical protein [Pseudomonadota bacterium]
MEKIKLPDLVQRFLEDITWKVNPHFTVRNKANPDGLYRVIRPFVMLFNKDIDTGYITVINGQCWFPKDYFLSDGSFDPERAAGVIPVLAHETIHEFDRKRLGTLSFTLAYLFPQILASLSLLSVLAAVNPAWLLCLFFLLFLTPIPAPGRAWLEIRGYKTNLSIAKLCGWDTNLYSFKIIQDHFVSPSYYYMMPIRSWVSKHLTNFDHEKEDIYMKIIDWYKKNMMVQM